MATVWTATVFSAVLAAQAAVGPENVAVLFKSKPTRAVAGDVVQLSLGVRIPEGWNLLPLSHESGSAFVSKLNVELPSGARFMEDWIEPEPKPAPSKLNAGQPLGVHHDAVVFRRRMRMPRSAKGTVRVSGSGQFLLKEEGSDRLAAVPPISFETTVEIVSEAETAKKAAPPPPPKPVVVLPTPPPEPEPEPPPVDQPKLQIELEGIGPTNDPRAPPLWKTITMYGTIIGGIAAAIMASVWVGRRGSA